MITLNQTLKKTTSTHLSHKFTVKQYSQCERLLIEVLFKNCFHRLGEIRKKSH